MIDAETRRYAATLGRRHFEGTVSLEALFEHFGESADPLIRALLEAAAHQPSRGFAGVSQKRWERSFWQPVSALIAELEKGEEGRPPATRIYPKSGIGGVVGSLAFSLFAGASAAEHAMRLLGLLRGATPASIWTTLFESLMLAMTGAATLAGLWAALFNLHLFRTRHNPFGDSDGHAR